MGEKERDKKNMPLSTLLRDSPREIRVRLDTFNRCYFPNSRAKMESRCTANENSCAAQISPVQTSYRRKSIPEFFHRDFIFRRVFTRMPDRVEETRGDEENARITSTWKHVVDEGATGEGRSARQSAGNKLWTLCILND